MWKEKEENTELMERLVSVPPVNQTVLNNAHLLGSAWHRTKTNHQNLPQGSILGEKGFMAYFMNHYCGPAAHISD